MSTPRKKKKVPAHKPSDSLLVSKEYFDRFSVTARKVLQLIDLEPELYDQFTKQEKHAMMIAKCTAPRFSIKEGHSVPRHYLKMVQKDSYTFLKTMSLGNPSIGLNYYDYTTMGSTFLAYVKSVVDKNNDCVRYSLYKQIDIQAEKYNNGADKHFLNGYCDYLQFVMFSISKVNYRIYGFNWEWGATKDGFLFAAHIALTSIESKRIYFLYQNKSRPAYKMIRGQYISPIPHCLTVPYNKIFSDSPMTHDLDVYVQSHVLLRIKERLDVLAPIVRNCQLFYSLKESNIIQLNSGKYAFKFINDKQEVVGYLPFTIIDNNLLVLTFLPLSNYNVPEGKKLGEILKVNKEDLIFCGMDKLSFYVNTDFDAVPQLKEALISANMWHLTEMIAEEENENREKQPGYIAKFFQQPTLELNKEEILMEIANQY